MGQHEISKKLNYPQNNTARWIPWQTPWTITETRSLLKYELQLLAKTVLIPLGLTTVASATDTEIHKKIIGLGPRH